MSIPSLAALERLECAIERLAHVARVHQAATVVATQDYINDTIVQQKRDANDYVVSVSPIFEIDGNEFRMVVDGNHSLEAAKIDGVEPEFVEEGGVDEDEIPDFYGNVDRRFSFPGTEQTGWFTEYEILNGRVVGDC